MMAAIYDLSLNTDRVPAATNPKSGMSGCRLGMLSRQQSLAMLIGMHLAMRFASLFRVRDQILPFEIPFEILTEHMSSQDHPE